MERSCIGTHWHSAHEDVNGATTLSPTLSDAYKGGLFVASGEKSGPSAMTSPRNSCPVTMLRSFELGHLNYICT